MNPRSSRRYSGRPREMGDVEKVYHMLKPKPKPLLVGRRELVRHGELIYFSPNTVSKKPRYFFLFSDVLLLTKRVQQAKFLLKIFVHLRGSVKVVPLKNSPTHEFRLLVAERGTLKKRKERRIILFGKNEAHKQAWLRDLQHSIWGSNGKKGPDPSGIDRSQGDPRDDDEEDDDEDEEEERRSRSHRSKSKSKPNEKKAPKKPEVEALDDISYGSSSEDDDEEGASLTGDNSDPLIIFDPFENGSSNQQGKDAFGMEPFNGEIPKGVMLPPLGNETGSNSGAGPYGMSQFSMSNPYGMSSQYPMGAAPYPFASDPYAFNSSNPYSSSAYTTGTSSLSDMSTSFAPVTSGSAQAFSSSSSMFPSQPVSYGASPYDQNNLYGAAKDTSTALSGMMGTQSTQGSQQYSGSTDLDQIAQKELLEATKLIEEIARQLASRPRKVTDPSPDAPLTVDHVSDAILDGTSAIARAASILLKASAEAQRERVDHEKRSGKAYHPDPVWSNGLISAAREVVATTRHLVGTANEATQGQAQEGALVACSRAVGAATTQLVSAERAKGNIMGQPHRNLEAAAKGISKATNQLVEAAQLASASQGGGHPQAVNNNNNNEKYNITEKKIAEIEAQTKVLALEAETQRAREALLSLRKNEYKE